MGETELQVSIKILHRNMLNSCYMSCFFNIMYFYSPFLSFSKFQLSAVLNDLYHKRVLELSLKVSFFLNLYVLIIFSVGRSGWVGN